MFFHQSVSFKEHYFYVFYVKHLLKHYFLSFIKQEQKEEANKEEEKKDEGYVAAEMKIEVKVARDVPEGTVLLTGARLMSSVTHSTCRCVENMRERERERERV